MKNRNWFCLALDATGVIALIGAAMSLSAALWFNALVAEAVLFSSFTYCLMSAVGAFLTARMFEIAKLLQLPAVEQPAPAVAEYNNVESLPERAELPRAA